jgi:hypothetical protein
VIAAVRRIPARVIVVAGWIGLLVYANPGFMSYDSIVQLEQARADAFGGGHPPVMGLVWKLCDAVVAGPLVMLVVQTGCFVAGAYLLLRRWLAPRAAAVATVAVAWFPSVSSLLAVVWKDSQMVGWLVLGIALLGSAKRGVRLGGLALCAVAGAMRFNAPVMTLVVVTLLFAWDVEVGGVRRYAIAIGAWVVITAAGLAASAALVGGADGAGDAWHDSLALLDIVGTIREAPPLSDAELRDDLAGTPLVATTDIQTTARRDDIDVPAADLRALGGGDVVPALWVTTRRVFAIPANDDERAAIGRAWRRVVLGHPTAFLAYRWSVFRHVVHLDDDDTGTSAYVAFVDTNAIAGHEAVLGHNAAPSKLQGLLRRGMYALGSTWLFRPVVYLVLVLVLAPVWLRDRTLAALALSALANEAVLFVIAPTTDFRYSAWLVVATLLVAASAVRRWLQPSPILPEDRPRGGLPHAGVNL